MEKMIISPQIRPQIDECLKGFMTRDEKAVLGRILEAIGRNDVEQLQWFGQFGGTLRHVIMNVRSYEKGLEFGFDEIGFDKYGWLSRPALLDVEELKFGDTARYGRHSSIRLGRGLNGIWTNALCCQYGTAGESSPLCVFGFQFRSREAALDHCLQELKRRMTAKLGHSDRTNYHQDVITATLKAIRAFEVSQVQLTLF